MPKGFHKGLTPDLILDAAFAIVDREGEPALSMRQLAKRLGVAAMAIYNHFPDRDALLDALANRAFAAPPEQAVPPPHKTAKKSQARDIEPWKQKLRAIVASVQTLAMRHPHVYRLAITRPVKPEAAFEIMTASMSALREAGLSDAQAVTAYHTFVILLHGLPFWLEVLDRHCSGQARPPVNAISPKGIADWKRIQGVEAEAQFQATVDWLLDAIGRTATAKISTPRLAKSKDAAHFVMEVRRADDVGR
jgi:AcrR family transcriptional regulator